MSFVTENESLKEFEFCSFKNYTKEEMITRTRINIISIVLINITGVGKWVISFNMS